MSNTVLVALISAISAVAVGYMPIARDWLHAKILSDQNIDELRNQIKERDRIIKHQQDIIDSMYRRIDEVNE